MGMFFAMASLGLPAMGNFVGEFLVLLGVYQVSVPIAVLGTLGLIVATIYSLAMVQRTFLGPNRASWRLPDYGPRELGIMVAMVVFLLWMGLYPKTFLNTSGPAFEALEATAGGPRQGLSELSAEPGGVKDAAATSAPGQVRRSLPGPSTQEASP